MENNGLIDATQGGEWYSIVSASFGELYMLIAETGMRYYETATQFTPSGATFAQPSDLLSVIQVYWIDNTSTGTRRTLHPLMVSERSRYIGRVGGDTERYELAGSTFTLYPSPAGLGRTYELIYIPQPTDCATLTSSDTIDVVTADGEEFLIWNACVKAHAKQESDPQLAIAERERYRTAVLEWANLRLFTDPQRRMVLDVNNDNWPYGYVDDADFWNRPR